MSEEKENTEQHDSRGRNYFNNNQNIFMPISGKNKKYKNRGIIKTITTIKGAKTNTVIETKDGYKDVEE